MGVKLLRGVPNQPDSNKNCNHALPLAFEPPTQSLAWLVRSDLWRSWYHARRSRFAHQPTSGELDILRSSGMAAVIEH